MVCLVVTKALLGAVSGLYGISMVLWVDAKAMLGCFSDFLVADKALLWCSGSDLQRHYKGVSMLFWVVLRALLGCFRIFEYILGCLAAKALLGSNGSLI